MMHPRFAVEREYAVRIVGELKPAQIARLRNGIELSDGRLRACRSRMKAAKGTNHWYRIVLREGRNRVVRRLFEALGLTVSRLMRVRFGVVALPPRLKRGQVSALPAAEVKQLLAWLDENAPAERASSKRLPRNREDAVVSAARFRPDEAADAGKRARRARGCARPPPPAGRRH